MSRGQGLTQFRDSLFIIMLKPFSIGEQNNNSLFNMYYAVFALNQIKNILPLNIRKIVYNSLVRSHIEYGGVQLKNRNFKK